MQDKTKITAFTFLCSKSRNEQVSSSNLYENKSHFNYTRFLKLLSWEHKQNESLFKIKTVLTFEYLFAPYFEKERGKKYTDWKQEKREKNKEKKSWKKNNK